MEILAQFDAYGHSASLFAHNASKRQRTVFGGTCSLLFKFIMIALCILGVVQLIRAGNKEALSEGH